MLLTSPSFVRLKTFIFKQGSSNPMYQAGHNLSTQGLEKLENMLAQHEERRLQDIVREEEEERARRIRKQKEEEDEAKNK